MRYRNLSLVARRFRLRQSAFAFGFGGQASLVKRKDKPNGFTLLEVLLATLILTAGVIALAWAFTSGLFATTDVENVDLALNIAQGRMEQLKNTPFASLADSPSAADSDFPRFSAAVNVAEGQNPMQVDVTVSWNTKDGSLNLVLTTLIADYSTQ